MSRIKASHYIEEGQIACGNNCKDGSFFFILIALVFGIAFIGHVSEGNVKSIKPVHTQQQVAK